MCFVQLGQVINLRNFSDIKLVATVSTPAKEDGSLDGFSILKEPGDRMNNMDFKVNNNGGDLREKVKTFKDTKS